MKIKKGITLAVSLTVALSMFASVAMADDVAAPATISQDQTMLASLAFC